MSDVAPEGQEMTFDQAAKAIESAVSSDPDFGGSPAEVEQATQPPVPETPAPDQAEAPPTPGEDAPDEGTTAFDAPDVEEDSLWAGENINPDLLPEELKPLAKQFEAAYTRKTQALAEQRKTLEALGSEEDIQQALDFYGSLKDPDYLRDFYNELGSVVQELGLVEGPPAADEPEEPAAPVIPEELSGLTANDPELQPLVEQIATLKQQLEGFTAQQAAEREELEEQRALMAQAQVVSQQVDAVRAEHPEYGDDDWEVIYDLADANDGDVLRGAELFASINERAISAWTAAKGTTPAAVEGTPGAGTISHAVEEESDPANPRRLKDVDAEAIAYLNANDMAEYTG